MKSVAHLRQKVSRVLHCYGVGMLLIMEDMGQKPVVRANEVGCFCLADNRSALTAHPWIYDYHMDSSTRKIAIRGINQECSTVNILWRNSVREINNLDLRIDIQDYAFHSTDVVIACPKIGH
jgi:hypothetical protein